METRRRHCPCPRDPGRHARLCMSRRRGGPTMDAPPSPVVANGTVQDMCVCLCTDGRSHPRDYRTMDYSFTSRSEIAYFISVATANQMLQSHR